MSPDIRETLHGAARSPGQPIDTAELRQRGRRRRTGQVLGTTALAVVVGIAGVQALNGSREVDGPPVITPVPSSSSTDGPTAEPTEAPTGSPSDPEVLRSSAATIGTSIATSDAEGRAIVLRHPDGGFDRLDITTSDSAVVRWYPGPGGGVWWQDHGDTRTEGSSPIHFTHVDGDTVIVVPATDSFEESWRLVGDGLATWHTGTMPDTANDDLVQLTTDGGVSVLREGVAGWESGVGEAVAQESILWSGGGEGFEWVTHSPPDRPDVQVFEGGEINGEHEEGIAQTTAGLRVVLVVPGVAFPDQPEGRLLLVDEEGQVTSEVLVPADLGTSTWNIPRMISGATDHILVNRYAEGTWLEALVLDLDGLTWSVLDQPGLSRFAETPPTTQPEPTSQCATQDDDLRNAPPGDTYWLYWSCDGSPDLFDLYRAESWSPPNSGPTGGVTVTSFLRMHLEAMLEGPSTGARDAGYQSIVPESAGVEVASVSGLDNGRYVVDFTIAPGGTGWRNESAASAMWTRQLASHLFQLQAVSSVELRLDGSCDAYSGWFEGDGCTVLTPDDTAWNAST